MGYLSGVNWDGDEVRTFCSGHGDGTTLDRPDHHMNVIDVLINGKHRGTGMLATERLLWQHCDMFYNLPVVETVLCCTVHHAWLERRRHHLCALWCPHVSRNQWELAPLALTHCLGLDMSCSIHGSSCRRTSIRRTLCSLMITPARPKYFATVNSEQVCLWSASI